MTNTSQRLATYLGCGCALLLAACGSASGSNPPSAHDSKLVRTPWDEITRAKRPRTLLINTIQGTADKSAPCFIHYTARVVSQTSHRISIELLARDREDRTVRCAANAVRGPFWCLCTSRSATADRGSSIRPPDASTASSLAPSCRNDANVVAMGRERPPGGAAGWGATFPRTR